ncbi:MAG TPA: TonB-dependent receptor [Gammaproteobacteria bacterium]|nr:TonB-dependent receptor [Gammaproteobacteria bacterium]
MKQSKRPVIWFATCLPLALSLRLYAAEPITLDTISITASRTPVSLNATGSAVTVITGQTLRDSQQRYVADLLRTVPGLAVSQSGSMGGLTQIRVRGSEADHLLVIVDGIEINPGNGGSVNFAHLMTADIERIEILRGAQSALWGADAIGGVIAITTRQGRSGENRVNISVEEGSFNSSQYSATVSGGRQSTTYALNVSRVNTDGFSAADDDAFTYTLPDGSRVTQGGSGVEDDSYNNRTVGGTIRHAFSDDLSVNAAVRQINYQVNYDGFAGGSGAIDDAVSGTSSKGVYAQTTLRYLQLDNRLQHSLKVSDTDLDDTFSSAFGSSAARAKKRQYSYQLDYYFPQTSNSSHGVTVAVEREENSNDSSFSGFNKNSATSAIAEYRFDYDERLSTAIAYRRDNNKIFQNSDVAHASLSYEINSALRFHGSAGTGIKNPTLRQLFGSSASFPGNRALKAEKSESIDAGLEWQMRPHEVLDVTLFELRIEDQIIGSGNTSENVDGKTKAMGMELSYQGEFAEQWSLVASLTHQSGEDAEGNDLVRRADTIASLNITHRSLANKLRTTLGINYNGRQTDYYFDASFIRSPVKVDAYTVVNLAASYQLNETVELTGRIVNLFDETYQEVIGYGTPERSYYAGLRINI